MSPQQPQDDTPRGTVPRNPPRGGASDGGQATASQPAAGQQSADSGTDASRGQPGVMGQQGGDASASNRPEQQGGSGRPR